MMVTVSTVLEIHFSFNSSRNLNSLSTTSFINLLRMLELRNIKLSLIVLVSSYFGRIPSFSRSFLWFKAIILRIDIYVDCLVISSLEKAHKKHR